MRVIYSESATAGQVLKYVWPHMPQKYNSGIVTGNTTTVPCIDFMGKNIGEFEGSFRFLEAIIHAVSRGLPPLNCSYPRNSLP